MTWDKKKQGSSESPPIRNRATSFEGAGVVDEGWPGNDERGLPVEWYGSLKLKNLSKNILKRGWILRQNLFLREGYVTSCLLPPPPPLQKLIMHHGTYRDRGLVSKSCTHQKLASFARTQYVVNKASYEYT